MKNHFLTYFWLFICSFSLLSAQAQSGNACGFTETGSGTTLQDVQISIATITALCQNEGFTALPSISITEIAEGERAINGDEPTSLALVFELPEGLEFKKAGNGIKILTSGSISFQNINVQSNAIFVFLTGASPTQTDAITLSGVEVRPVGANAGDYFVSVSTAIGCVNGIAKEGNTVAGKIKVIAAPPEPGTTFNAGPHFCLGDVIPPGFLTVNSTGNLRYYSDAALSNELTAVADPNHPTAAELYFDTSSPGTQQA